MLEKKFYSRLTFKFGQGKQEKQGKLGQGSVDPNFFLAYFNEEVQLSLYAKFYCSRLPRIGEKFTVVWWQVGQGSFRYQQQGWCNLVVGIKISPPYPTGKFSPTSRQPRITKLGIRAKQIAAKSMLPSSKSLAPYMSFKIGQVFPTLHLRTKLGPSYDQLWTKLGQIQNQVRTN